MLTDATTDFELPVAFRFGTAAGDIKGIKLVALSYPDPKAPDVEARSNELPLELKIVAGTKPTPEQPLVIFEDQEDMLANLNQGGGKAELSSDEKFSGKVGLKVTPDQKSNPTLPGLSAKNPAESRPGRISLPAVCLEENRWANDRHSTGARRQVRAGGRHAGQVPL